MLGVDWQAVIDASELAGRHGEEALGVANGLVAEAMIEHDFDTANRWRNARHFLVRHFVIEQHLQ